MDKLKIVFLSAIKLTVYGGGERWIMDIGNELVEKGYKVTVITSNWIPPKEKERVSLGKLFKQIKFEYKIMNKFFIKFRSFVEFFTLFNDVDILYLTDWYPHVLQPIVSVYINKIKRIVIGTHSPFSYQHKTWRYKMHIIKIISKKLNKYNNFIFIHALNSLQAKWYKKLGFKHIYLVPNFIDSKYYLYPQKTENFVILFLGRFTKQKGIDLLPQIIEKVLKKIKKIKFWVCGSGDPYYESLIKKLEKRYPKNVKYFGFVPEERKVELLSKASLFLVPSRTEGQPIAVLEALVSGSPFLGSNIIAFNDLIKLYNKSFGWIAKEYKPETFAEKILEIYQKWKENPDKYFEERRYIAEKAREIFDIKKVVDTFIYYFLL